MAIIYSLYALELIHSVEKSKTLKKVDGTNICIILSFAYNKPLLSGIYCSVKG